MFVPLGKGQAGQQGVRRLNLTPDEDRMAGSPQTRLRRRPQTDGFVGTGQKSTTQGETFTAAPPLQPPVPQNVTCREPRLSGWLLYGHREGGRGGRGLRTGQRPVPSKRDGHASCLQRRLVVSQLVNTLLLQQKGLLRGKEAGSC